MLEQIKYKNHMNEIFEFGKDGIYINTSELHDYDWTVTTKNKRITDITYGITKRKIPIVIICATEAEGIAARNKLFEVMEKDVLALQPGRIIVGDYYYTCYAIKSTKMEYLKSKRYMKVSVTVTSDRPYWIKETSYIFQPSSGGGAGMDYPHDYPFDYYANIASQEINNTGFVASNFRMVINGPCVDPAVHINGHKYKVNCTVTAGQLLTIDSVSKTVTLADSGGTVTNVFNSRDKDSYIFEKIPSGRNNVLWSGNYTFETVLLEERSEPKWT